VEKPSQKASFEEAVGSEKLFAQPVSEIKDRAER